MLLVGSLAIGPGSDLLWSQCAALGPLQGEVPAVHGAGHHLAAAGGLAEASAACGGRGRHGFHLISADIVDFNGLLMDFLGFHQVPRPIARIPGCGCGRSTEKGSASAACRAIWMPWCASQWTGQAHKLCSLAHRSISSLFERLLELRSGGNDRRLIHWDLQTWQAWEPSLNTTALCL